MLSTGVGTLVVVDEQRRVTGLLTTRDRLVAHTDEPDLAQAEEMLRTHKIKKLSLLDSNDTLRGLITAKDLIAQRQLPFATRDAQGRLRTAAGAARARTEDYKRVYFGEQDKTLHGLRRKDINADYNSKLNVLKGKRAAKTGNLSAPRYERKE